MSNDNRGTISQQGGVMSVKNALAEEIYVQSGCNGYLTVSYAVCESNSMISVKLLRLAVGKNTVLLNSLGQTMCLCNIRKGMWIDALFSPIMTRSIPPQSNAFLIIARNDLHSSASVTTDRIISVDVNNRFIYTGNPNNSNSQMRFVLPRTATITDSHGNPTGLRFLRPGQLVRVTHANFQTASIPPQSTAFHVQIL
ncbi:MAG: hypothetical protein QM697_08810 [Lachnospiraceae bacterium]